MNPYGLRSDVPAEIMEERNLSLGPGMVAREKYILAEVYFFLQGPWGYTWLDPVPGKGTLGTVHLLFLRYVPIHHTGSFTCIQRNWDLKRRTCKLNAHVEMELGGPVCRTSYLSGIS